MTHKFYNAAECKYEFVHTELVQVFYGTIPRNQSRYTKKKLGMLNVIKQYITSFCGKHILKGPFLLDNRMEVILYSVQQINGILYSVHRAGGSMS